MFFGCQPEEYKVSYEPTPYEIPIPEGFPPMPAFPDNPTTVEGVALGRRLFYDPILSGDDSQSCSSCHQQAFGFSDPKRFSPGIDGITGNRNSMALVNLAWSKNFFWDGRAGSLEAQALEPVPNPIEMHEEWVDAEEQLRGHDTYPALFTKAFGSPGIDSTRVTKALAQFMRTLVSGNTRVDDRLNNKPGLTPSESVGLALFIGEVADCWHCHPAENRLFTDDAFRNNGLDSTFEADRGRAEVTGSQFDEGKFKVPSLRNIALTAPYMHDGRFETLEEVIEHYESGGHPSPTLDPQMMHSGVGIGLSQEEKEALVDFLEALTDEEFINNPAFSDPFN